MTPRDQLWLLIEQCANLEIPKEQRQRFYTKALELVRTTKPQKLETKGFDEFWACYPNKVAKGYAEKAYAKAIKEVTLEVIIGGVEYYKRNKPDTTPWAHPASWLNAKRWLDGQYKKPVEIVYEWPEWPEWKELLAKRIGKILVVQWFTDVSFNDGILTVPNKLAYDWINERYSIDLRAVLGEYEMRIK